MYPVSARFLEALRFPHTACFRMDIWRDGDLLEYDVPFGGGAVSVDGTSPTRRTLRTSLPKSLWSTVAPYGTELRPYRGIDFGDAQELVPLGVFPITEPTMTELGTEVGITAPDRFQYVVGSQFDVTSRTAAGSALAAATAIVRAAMPGAALDVVNEAWDSDYPVPTTVYSGTDDRSTAAQDIFAAAAVDAAFDVDGRYLLRRAPSLAFVDEPAWTVDTGPRGVMIDAQRTRARERTYNVVIVESAALSGAAPFPPVIVQDLDPNSPTYVHGPFGRHTYRYSSPCVITAAQARIVGRMLLARLRSRTEQGTATQPVNPALDAFDVVATVYGDGTSALRLVESFDVPLDEGSAQTLTFREARGYGATSVEGIVGDVGGLAYSDLLNLETYDDLAARFASYDAMLGAGAGV